MSSVGLRCPGERHVLKMYSDEWCVLKMLRRVSYTRAEDVGELHARKKL